MTDSEAKAAVLAAREHFKSLDWNEKDINLGMAWLSVTIERTYDLPIVHHKFAEVLRVYANILESVYGKTK